MSTEREYFQIPSFCPICSGPTSEEGDFLYCRTKTCPAKLPGTIRVWVKKLGLLHWGDALIDSICEKLNVSSLADLYRLSVEDITTCCSGRKVAQKCWGILQDNKKISLETLLSALNIPNLGTATAISIVQAGFNTTEKLLAITYDDLLKVPDIGEITARQVLDGIQERSEVIQALSGVLDIRKPSSGPLEGLSFCITGATSKPRKAVQKDIINAGGIAKDSVSAGLSYLVTNEDLSRNTSKMQKAQKLGTKIISEADLYKLMMQS